MRALRHRIGLLGATLLALGAIDLPPPKRSETDLAEAEEVMRLLRDAGLDPLVVAERSGETDFVKLGRAVLEVQRVSVATGPARSTEECIELATALFGQETNQFQALRGLSTTTFSAQSVRVKRAPYPDESLESLIQAVERTPPGTLDLSKFEPGSEVVIGDAEGRALAHVRLPAQQNRAPILGNRVSIPKPSPAQQIAELVLADLTPRTKPRGEPARARPHRDRAGQKMARKAKARAKARKGWS